MWAGLTYELQSIVVDSRAIFRVDVRCHSGSLLWVSLLVWRSVLFLT